MNRRRILQYFTSGATLAALGTAELMNTSAATAAGERVRKSIFALTQSEINRLTTALNAIKNSGAYDEFVRMHQTGMNGRNMSIHMGPAFLPWHRAYLIEMEDALQQVDDRVTIPYWPWGETSESRFRTWVSRHFGGDGDPRRGFRVLTGPFANWRCVEYNNGFWMRNNAGLVRRFGNSRASLPWSADINAVLSIQDYDTSPWDMTSEGSFRNSLEGWANPDGLVDGRSYMHNQVHRWIGGDMIPGTSPNDPLFFLHHANVDRLWAIWQSRNNSEYLPEQGSRSGQNFNDTMGFLRREWTPQSVIDTNALGVTYA